MSEANTPNTHPLESDLSPNGGRLSKNNADSMQTENAGEQLSTSAEAANPFEQLFPSNSDNLTTASGKIDTEALQVNLNDDLPEDNFAKNTDWFALARQLHQQNRDLIKKVVQLEQALADSQEQLPSQIRRSPSADTLIVQQTEELNASQEQVTSLTNELEASLQTAQSQQILIETLSKQLEASQEQVAQLERECAVLQENYNEQAYKLLETEKQAQELRSRLHRQQRYTLQFKAALDQSLEVPPSNAAISQQSEGKTFSASLIPKVKPIQPWSTQRDKFDYPPDTNPNHTSTSLDNGPLDSDPIVPSPEKAIVEPESELEQKFTVETDVPLELDASKSSSDAMDSETENSSAELLEEPDSNEPHPSNEAIKSPQSNRPSPVIEPVPPAKKRKSRAKIDLPKFIR
ncbi:MAG: hypothetical protein AB4426_12210 [Xenococcaceae cyanobacterium]